MDHAGASHSPALIKSVKKKKRVEYSNLFIKVRDSEIVIGLDRVS